MAAASVSPFVFLTWKEDENALVASTSNTTLGYIQLLQVDGLDVDEIMAHAVAEKGEKAFTSGLAASFPAYVAAVAAAKGVPCFVTTRKAKVEYADLNTGEVGDGEFEATEKNYAESVGVELAREEHDRTTGGTASSAAGAAAGAAAAEAAPSGATPSGGADGGGGDDDDDDDYEDVDEDEDAAGGADGGKVDPEDEACVAKQRMLQMVSTQLETALSIGFDLNLTIEEMKAAYKAAVPGPFPVPETPEECMETAQKDPALQQYVANLYAQGGSSAAQGCPQQ